MAFRIFAWELFPHRRVGGSNGLAFSVLPSSLLYEECCVGKSARATVRISCLKNKLQRGTISCLKIDYKGKEAGRARGAWEAAAAS